MHLRRAKQKLKRLIFKTVLSLASTNPLGVVQTILLSLSMPQAIKKPMHRCSLLRYSKPCTQFGLCDRYCLLTVWLFSDNFDKLSYITYTCIHAHTTVCIASLHLWCSQLRFSRFTINLPVNRARSDTRADDYSLFSRASWRKEHAYSHIRWVFLRQIRTKKRKILSRYIPVESWQHVSDVCI